MNLDLTPLVLPVLMITLIAISVLLLLIYLQFRQNSIVYHEVCEAQKKLSKEQGELNKFNKEWFERNLNPPKAKEKPTLSEDDILKVLLDERNKEHSFQIACNALVAIILNRHRSGMPYDFSTPFVEAMKGIHNAQTHNDKRIPKEKLFKIILSILHSHGEVSGVTDVDSVKELAYFIIDDYEKDEPSIPANTDEIGEVTMLIAPDSDGNTEVVITGRDGFEWTRQVRYKNGLNYHAEFKVFQIMAHFDVREVLITKEEEILLGILGTLEKLYPSKESCEVKSKMAGEMICFVQELPEDMRLAINERIEWSVPIRVRTIEDLAGAVEVASDS